MKKLKPEIDLWPQVWDRDFGFAPIGARKIEPAMNWYYNDTPIDRERHNWLEPERQMLYEAIIAAAISHLGAPQRRDGRKRAVEQICFDRHDLHHGGSRAGVDFTAGLTAGHTQREQGHA